MVEELAQFLGLSFSKPWFKNYLIAEKKWDDHQLILFKPLTYMNHSGLALGPFLDSRGLTPAQVVVMVDQMDLPPGACRLRASGGSAGHNGLKSLEAWSPDNSFPRLYLGIGRPEPGTSVVDHVLSSPKPDQRNLIQKRIKDLREPLLRLFEDPWDRVVELVNRKS